MNVQHFYTLDQPLHVLPEKSQVRSANLSGFRNLINRLGGDCRYVLGRHGIGLQAPESPDDFIDCRSVVQLLEYCALKFNNPLFGLELAQMQEPDVYGSVTAICRSAPTLRKAVECLVQYIPVIHSSESVLELVEGTDIAEFRWCERNNMGFNIQANFHGLQLNLKVLRMLGGPHFSPRYISIPRQVTWKTISRLEQAIECEVRVSSDKGCIAFSSDLLELPLPTANLPLFQLLEGYMSRLRPSPDMSLEDRVNGYLRDSLGSGDISIEGCARKIGISARTLQLRLKERDVCYSDILDKLRLERAKQVLKCSNLSVSQVADLLGYAERTSFDRAFKRWTGLSPRQYREH